jgi:hypothetical protein
MIWCLIIQLVALLLLVADNLSRLCKQSQLDYFKSLISTIYIFLLHYFFKIYFKLIKSYFYKFGIPRDFVN